MTRKKKSTSYAAAARAEESHSVCPYNNVYTVTIPLFDEITDDAIKTITDIQDQLKATAHLKATDLYSPSESKEEISTSDSVSNTNDLKSISIVGIPEAKNTPRQIFSLVKQYTENHELVLKCGSHGRLTIRSTSPKLREASEEICRIFHARISSGATTSCVITRAHLDLTEEDVAAALTEAKLPFIRVWRITSKTTNNPSHLIRILSAGDYTTQHLINNGILIFGCLYKCEASHPPGINTRSPCPQSPSTSPNSTLESPIISCNKQTDSVPISSKPDIKLECNVIKPDNFLPSKNLNPNKQLKSETMLAYSEVRQQNIAPVKQSTSQRETINLDDINIEDATIENIITSLTTAIINHLPSKYTSIVHQLLLLYTEIFKIHNFAQCSFCKPIEM